MHEDAFTGGRARYECRMVNETIDNLTIARNAYREVCGSLEEENARLREELRRLRELRDTVITSSLDGTVLRAMLTGFELGREA